MNPCACITQLKIRNITSTRCGLSWPLHKIAPALPSLMLLCGTPRSLSHNLYYWVVLSFLCPPTRAGTSSILFNQVSPMPRPASAQSLVL